MANNVNLSQEITHVGTDHITLVFGGDSSHNGSSVTKSFNVAKADIGTLNITNFPSTAIENDNITFRISSTDTGGYNPFSIDEFSLVLLIDGNYYRENGSLKVYSSNTTNGYAEITFNIGSGTGTKEIALSINSSTHYVEKDRVTIGTVNVSSEQLPITASDFYNIANWTEGTTFNMGERKIVLDDNNVPIGKYKGIPLLDLLDYVVYLRLTPGNVGYAFGLSDENGDDYLILADNGVYIKEDPSGVETDITGNYQTVSIQNNVLLRIIFTDTGDGLTVAIKINNGADYTFNVNSADLLQTYLIFLTPSQSYLDIEFVSINHV